MQADFYPRFTSAITADRLNAFRDQGLSDLDVISRYVWNTLLCEAIYPALQCFEVGIRNSMHNALAYQFGRADWYESPKLFLDQRDCVSINVAKSALIRDGKTVEPGRVVAELSFGFWASLFSRKYEHPNRRLWPTLLPRVFPSKPKAVYRRDHVSSLIEKTRKLRNRVFHHERILHWNSPQIHANVIDMLNWISPTLAYANAAVDRFDSVYSAGWIDCKRRLASFQNSPEFII